MSFFQRREDTGLVGILNKKGREAILCVAQSEERSSPKTSLLIRDKRVLIREPRDLHSIFR